MAKLTTPSRNPPHRRGTTLGSPTWSFFRHGLRAWHRSHGLFPSSRFLADAMLRPIDWSQVRVVLELGPGTGALTRKILERLPDGGRLFAIELDEAHVATLRARLRDPRLTLIHGDAADATALLRAYGAGTAHAVVSSLGLSMIPAPARGAILDGVRGVLRPGGVFTQYAYVHTPYAVYSPSGQPRWSRFDAGRFVARYFPRVERRTVVWNLPPATVLACRR